MPSKFKIDRRTAQTFEVVHRARDDPLFYDDEASQSVLVEKIRPQHKAKLISGSELAAQAEEFAKQGRRDNEGEAAMYGITYDDSTYDYMQHLKPIGQASDSVFISKNGEISIASQPKTPTNSRKKGRGASVLQFRNELEEQTAPRAFQLPPEVMPSKAKLNVTHESQQAIPDSLRGFQPNLDPRLREVLEALDNEDFVEDDEDIFKELIEGGVAEDEDEWKQTLEEEELKQRPGEADWEFDFRKFKLESKKAASDDDNDSFSGSRYADSVSCPSEGEEDDYIPGTRAAEARDKIGALPSIQPSKPKKKKKIGAQTDLSSFSMSSSASYRNKGLTMIDDQFEEYEVDYAEDNDDVEVPTEEFDMKKERPDFDNIMDEFLAAQAVKTAGMRKPRKMV